MPHFNPDHAREMIELINNSNYFKTLDMHIEELASGYCRASLTISDRHLNAFGGAHGGAYASLLDCVYWAAYADMPEDMGYTTLDLNNNYLRAVTGGKITLEGHVVKKGGTIQVIEGSITDEKGRLICTTVSKMYCSPTIQPLSAAVEIVRNGDPLPPKFIEG